MMTLRGMRLAMLVATAGANRALFQHRMKLHGQDNEDSKFLVDNAKKEGVVVLPSGLQYKVEKAAPSDAPFGTQYTKCTIHYVGYLITGQIFDSSRHRGPPETYVPARDVMDGFSEALRLMRPGDRWTLYIGKELTYGMTIVRRLARTDPYATLIYDVEILSHADPSIWARVGLALLDDYWVGPIKHWMVVVATSAALLFLMVLSNKKKDVSDEKKND